MVQTRKYLKLSSIAVLALAFFSLLQIVSELLYGDLNNAAIAYVESTDQYAIMVDDRVEYYNANFGYVSSFRIFNFGNGPYQICADDNYVYVMFVSNDGVGRNVHVYLHNGKALGKVSIQKTSNPNPTGISIVDGYLYVSIPDGSLRTLLKKIE